MATHSCIWPGKFHREKEPGRLQCMWLQRVRHNWVTFTHFTTSFSEKLGCKHYQCVLQSLPNLFALSGYISKLIQPQSLSTSYLFLIRNSTSLGLVCGPELWERVSIILHCLWLYLYPLGLLACYYFYFIYLFIYFATTFKSYTQKLTCKIHMEMSLHKFREIL